MRVSLRIFALAAALMSSSPYSSIHGFSPISNIHSRHYSTRTTLYSSDPTKTFIASLADNVQQFLTKSSLNNAKIALVKALAGKYDQEAVRSKLNSLIEDEPVLMMSFTT